MRTVVTFLKAAILCEFVIAYCPALAASVTHQDRIANSIPDETHYPEGYRALRLAADAIEQEELEQEQHALASSSPAVSERPVSRPPALSRRAAEAPPIARPSNLPLIARGVIGRRRLEPLDLFPCRWWLHVTPSTSEPADALLEYTARSVAYVDHRLRSYGYPPQIFEGPVGEYERAMLTLALEAPAHAGERPDGNALPWLTSRVDPLEERLINSLEAGRIRQELNLPIIAHPDNICAVNSMRPHARSYVRAIPADGRVWVIPVFYFYVCRNTVNIPDPWSIDRCRWWREVHPDEASLLVGRQKYQARWRDGAVSRGERTFEDFDGEPVVVHVRRD
jgi:hypothetical protein